VFGGLHAVLKQCSTQNLIFVTSPAPCKKRKDWGTLLLCFRGLGYGLDLWDFFFGGISVGDYNFFVFFLIIWFFVFFFFVIFAAPGVFA